MLSHGYMPCTRYGIQPAAPHVTCHVPRPLGFWQAFQRVKRSAVYPLASPGLDARLCGPALWGMLHATCMFCNSTILSTCCACCAVRPSPPRGRALMPPPSLMNMERKKRSWGSGLLTAPRMSHGPGGCSRREVSHGGGLLSHGPEYSKREVSHEGRKDQ